jgi:hypothetical protein
MPTAELYSFVFLKEELDGIEWTKTSAVEFLTAQKIPFMQCLEDDKMLCFITKLGDEAKEYKLASIGQQVFIIVDKDSEEGDEVKEDIEVIEVKEEVK